MLPNCKLRLTRPMLRAIALFLDAGEFSLNRGLFFFVDDFFPGLSFFLSSTLFDKECNTGRFDSTAGVSWKE